MFMSTNKVAVALRNAKILFMDESKYGGGVLVRYEDLPKSFDVNKFAAEVGCTFDVTDKGFLFDI